MPTGHHFYYLASDGENVEPGLLYNPRGVRSDWAVIANVELFIRLNFKNDTFSYTAHLNEATPFRSRGEAEKIAFGIVMLNQDMMQKVRVKFV